MVSNPAGTDVQLRDKPSVAGSNSWDEAARRGYFNTTKCFAVCWSVGKLSGVWTVLLLNHENFKPAEGHRDIHLVAAVPARHADRLFPEIHPTRFPGFRRPVSV